MAANKRSPTMDFIIDQLKKNKKISYAEVRGAAAAKDLKTFPIMFGRAQALLGIVKMSARGEGKVTRAKAHAALVGTEKRGPGRPRKVVAVKQATGINTSSLDGIISAVRNSEMAKGRYRAALERIQSILGSALGS
ncbi:hypothetical protein LBMAG49_10760 [Planctomycetota bacterium]|jgi:hypothetical protein|nr:hypothetical protein LBMAG49_10760 [Planctomycetota bacterium]